MPDAPPTLNLKNPALAALLAWLVPGLGHIYQGRIVKGALFSLTICGLFFFGSWLGAWRVLYFRWDNEEWRFSYLGQIGVGLPAIPAAFDAFDVRPEFAKLIPPLAEYGAKPLNAEELRFLCERVSVPPAASSEETKERLKENGVRYVVTLDEVDDLHRRYGVTMHIAAIYTVIAGLLNILVIYDAAAGPAQLAEDQAEDEKRRREQGQAAA